MKRVISALLAALTLAFLLPSCGYFGKPDDEEIRKAVGELLPAAYAVTYIVYGPGLQPEKEAYEQFLKENEEKHFNNAHYVRIDPTQTFDLGNGKLETCCTEADIRRATLKVFSKDYADEILAYAFENNDQYMSRYNEYGGVLTIDVVKKQPMGMIRSFDLSTLKVVDGNSYACKAEIGCTYDDGETGTTHLQLVFENGKWLFNGAAY